MTYQRVYREDILCKFCNSKNIVKYGMKGTVQYFFCKDCNRKFADNKAPKQMRYPSQVIGSAINMFYQGFSFFGM